MAISDRMKKSVARVSTKKVADVADYGQLGAPLNRTNPFYFGFMAALGAIIALTLASALASVSQVFILILISLFLATGLNPAVEALLRRGMSRTVAVSTIFAGVAVFLIFFIVVVIPPLISQGSSLIRSAPELVHNLKNNSTINDLNNQFGVIDSLQKKVTSMTSDGTLLIKTFGGVIGVGRTILSGFFTFLTILVLTLYFITSLPQATELGLRFVPASRRDRVRKLTHAVIARVGAFVGSQIIIAFMASVFVTIMAFVLGLPSPLAIGMMILVCGIIPLIGHFLGCGITTIIALTQSIPVGIAAFIGYVLYVQVENYVVTPRIMKKRLAVPGAVTIISALIGSSLLGLIGGLLAVPVAASVILILEEVTFPRAENS